MLLLDKVNNSLFNLFSSAQGREVYTKTTVYYKKWLLFITFLVIVDLILLIIPKTNILKYFEYGLGLSIALIIAWLGSRLFDKFFQVYLLESAINRRINGELLVVGNIIADGLIILIVLLVFAQTHQVNLIALTASLGISGIAIAFAAQQTLSQLLGGIVLYIDRPFIVDDYIGLPDGTFGKVESIGLRSTKIRNSGKGTLSIIPNNSLTQMAIENFSGARKVLTLIYLTFGRKVSGTEEVLIRQQILESSKDIFGIDSKSTQIIFTDFKSDKGDVMTQAQINFFILGSGEMSMEIRGQLLDIAKQNMIFQLQQYGIDFEIVEKSVNVNAPISF
ncbi:MAG: mechanosensitive ion channel domain-containing protein [Lyngbya sp.]|nr:mechanosensitive ion channel domain-containing protein [Lyngbya sp.]